MFVEIPNPDILFYYYYYQGITRGLLVVLLKISIFFAYTPCITRGLLVVFLKISNFFAYTPIRDKHILNIELGVWCIVIRLMLVIKNEYQLIEDLE